MIQMRNIATKTTNARNRSIQFNSIQHLFTIPVKYFDSSLNGKVRSERGVEHTHNAMEWVCRYEHRELKIISFNRSFKICDTHWDCRITLSPAPPDYVCTIHFVCVANPIVGDNVHFASEKWNVCTVILCVSVWFTCQLCFVCHFLLIILAVSVWWWWRRTHMQTLHWWNTAKAMLYKVQYTLWGHDCGSAFYFQFQFRIVNYVCMHKYVCFALYITIEHTQYHLYVIHSLSDW